MARPQPSHPIRSLNISANAGPQACAGGVKMAAQLGVRRVLTLFLWAIVVCCIACFTLITFFRSSDYYRNTEFGYIRGNATLAFPADVPVLTQEVVKDGKTQVKNVGKNAPLWSGETAFIVSLQWGSMMIAGIAVAGLQHLERTDPSKPTAHTAKITTAASGPLATAWHQMRRVSSYQVAPRNLWSWWCGGLSVMDGFLVLTWLGLHVMYMYYLIDRKFQSAAVSVDPSASAAPVDAAQAQANIDARFLVKRLDGTGKSFGEVMRVSIMLIFIPVSRSTFLKWITGNDFPSIIKYHRWLSWGTIWLMITHSLLYLIEWGAAGDLSTELSWQDEAAKRNVCGLLSALGGLCIALTAHSWVRSNYYKLFYRTHIVGFLVFTIFALMHYKNLINWIAPGLVFYGLDRAFRYWQLASNITTVTTSDVSINGNILNICLVCRKASFPITPGQSVYLRCFNISWLASHPFTVAHVSDEDQVTRLTIHIRVGGPWTCALRQRFLTGQTARIQVEGPYPSKLDYVAATPVTVMVAGGSGVTPLLGLLRKYVSLSGDKAVTLPKIYLTWTSRNLSELKLFGSDLLLASTFQAGEEKQSTVNVTLSGPATDTYLPNSESWLHTSLHYTGFEQEQSNQQTQINVLADAKLAAFDSATKDNSEDISTSSCSGSPAATLSTHPASTPWLYAMCIVLAYFGAWAGLLLASYYDAYRQRTTAAGPNVLIVGVLQWVCVAAGAIVPPITFLAISHLIPSRMPHPTTTAVGAASKTQASFLNTTISVLPGYILAPAAGAGKHVVLSRGRPDIAGMLRDVRAAHPNAEEIVVLVAGPESMFKYTLEQCSLQNVAPGPQLVCKQVAHHF